MYVSGGFALIIIGLDKMATVQGQVEGKNWLILLLQYTRVLKRCQSLTEPTVNESTESGHQSDRLSEERESRHRESRQRESRQSESRERESEERLTWAEVALGLGRLALYCSVPIPFLMAVTTMCLMCF